MPRKTPYSGKQKKQQLKEKKSRKQDGPKYLAEWSDDEDTNTPDNTEEDSSKTEGSSSTDKRKLNNTDIQKLNSQPGSVNSFRLHFLKESDEVIEKRKKAARKPVKHLSERDLEYSLQDAYPPHMHLDFPKRPPWDYSLSKAELEKQEKIYFQSYLNEIMTQPCSDDVSYFELNLENWRQLWRVLEISDILLIIADIRYPVLHISPALINYVQDILKKPVIIVLNKIDFAPPVQVMAWKHYLQAQFPGIHVVCFTSFLKQQTSGGENFPGGFNASKGMFEKRKKGLSCCTGPMELFKAVKTIVKDAVDLSLWRQHLEDEGFVSSSSTDTGTDGDKKGIVGGVGSGGTDVKDHDSSGITEQATACEGSEGYAGAVQHSKLYHNGVATIGCIGYPNVGKSSVLNALRGKKVVSVSQTPGHTKHLQTIFLSPTVKLCDCPGLVFPSVVPKALQIIAGIFPVAQVREPYSTVRYLAERIDLLAILRLHHPNQGKQGKRCDWSAYDICDAFATKCGYLTSKAARPDMYRAANKILRLAVEGLLCLSLRPPDYSQYYEDLKSDASTRELHNTLLTAWSQFVIRSKKEDEEEDEEEEDDDEEEDSDDNIEVEKDEKDGSSESK